MAEKPVDYYAILEVSPTATAEQIRTAYKKAALKWHPDRVPTDSPERATRTKRFQQINDAYFTLSDFERRRDYDAARQWSSGDTTSEYADEEIPQSSSKKGGGWGGFFNPFASASNNEADDLGGEQWSSAFEEMMKDAEMAQDEQDGEKRTTVPAKRFWSIIGFVSGGSLGFIVGNLPGAAVGAVSGGKLGAIRDTHGKSVYQVFQSLPQDKKARVLSELAAKIFAQAVSG